MPNLFKRIKDALLHTFTPNELIINPATKTDPLSGFVVSTKFDNMSDMERNTLIQNILESYLTTKELSKIGLILPITPIEFKNLIFP